MYCTMFEMKYFIWSMKHWLKYFRDSCFYRTGYLCFSRPWLLFQECPGPKKYPQAFPFKLIALHFMEFLMHICSQYDFELFFRGTWLMGIGIVLTWVKTIIRWTIGSKDSRHFVIQHRVKLKSFWLTHVFWLLHCVDFVFFIGKS